MSIGDERLVLARIEEEKNELDIKISKLKVFVNSDRINKIDFEMKELLNDQLITMEEYSKILGKRINLLSSNLK